MSTLVTTISKWFWNEHIWLPPGYDWDSFKSPQLTNNKTVMVEPGEFAKFSDLLYPIPLALALIVARLALQRTVFRPLAGRLGLKSRTKPYHQHNERLEKVFRRRSSLSSQDMSKLSTECGLSSIQIERWFRNRRKSDQPDTTQKFCETAFRCIFYTVMLCYGVWCLWDKPWLWDIRYCWYDYPYHTVPTDVWCYYMMELSFYWSLSISQFFDVRRKDFLEMMIHHNATILLMMFSWTDHFTRIGTLVMILHDMADPFLELAKMFRYVNYQRTCDSIFGIFSLVWVITRCGIYPAHILYSTLYDAKWYIEFFSAYYIFNFLLVTLQILHVVWTYFLFKAIHKAVTVGGVDDKRSDSEGEALSEDENYNQVKKET